MKTELVKEWLASEGFRHDVDENGNIHFKYQGMNLFFTADEDDDAFFRLLMPNICEVSNAEDRVKLMEVCNEVNSTTKVVKAFIVNDNMWLAIEILIDSTPEVGDFFERCCDTLIVAYQRAGEAYNR